MFLHQGVEGRHSPGAFGDSSLAVSRGRRFRRLFHGFRGGRLFSLIHIFRGGLEDLCVESRYLGNSSDISTQIKLHKRYCFLCTCFPIYSRSAPVRVDLDPSVTSYVSLRHPHKASVIAFNTPPYDVVMLELLDATPVPAVTPVF